MSKNTLCYLGLGGNVGNPLILFEKVIEHFQSHPLATSVKESPRYASTPINATGPDYVNSVLEIDWAGSPNELLDVSLLLELQLGRIRTTNNAPRPIDIDVLLVGMHTVCSETLTLPHPRMHLRRFVLEPLLQLNPEAQLPNLGFARDFLPNTLNQDVRPV